MNDQGSETSTKENKKSSESKLKDMEICDINNREFKITVLKISIRYKKIYTGNLIFPENKSTNTLPKTLQL